MDTLEMVREFHEAFGVNNPDEARIYDFSLNKFRVELIREETKELEHAMAFSDKVGILDALLDIQYVLDGAFLQLGLAKYKDAGFIEVHRSNMSKLGPEGKPIKRGDGKVMKGPNFTPPDLEGVMRKIDSKA